MYEAPPICVIDHEPLTICSLGEKCGHYNYVMRLMKEKEKDNESTKDKPSSI